MTRPHRRAFVTQGEQFEQFLAQIHKVMLHTKYLSFGPYSRFLKIFLGKNDKAAQQGHLGPRHII